MTPRSSDAIVVIPGIMGSELADSDGKILWGLADPGWYVSAWTSGRALEKLQPTADELEGRYGRVRATRLLQFPAFAPMLAGVSPYSALIRDVRSAAWHRSAVLEFAYDWRLPVAYNGGLLAEAAARHLERWASSRECTAARRGDPSDGEPPGLVLAAHSMGGLVARQACSIPGFAKLIRTVVTLGTPFFGAPKAVTMLASGKGAPLPLPHARARDLAAALPGMYDLLPVYRCVTDGDGARRLSAADIKALGGDEYLAEQAFAAQENAAGTPLPGHVQVVGAHQPTVQSVTIDASTVTGNRYTIQRPGQAGPRIADLGGDGTVPRESGQLPGYPAMPLAQSHGALASTAEAILIVRDAFTRTPTGPWQGAAELGLDLPDVIAAGQPFTATISGARRATHVSCTVLDVATGRRAGTPAVRASGGVLAAEVGPLPPGLFWVQADGGGMSPVRQMIMASEPVP
jgi:hypothetical protein